MDNENVNVSNEATTNESTLVAPEVTTESTTPEVVAPVTPDHTASIPNLNPTDSAGQMALDKWIEERAKASVNKKKNPVLQPDKVVLINKDDPDNMYALKLHFPGTLTAFDIQLKSAISDENGVSGTDFVKLVKLAISNGVIAAPRITDIESFFDNHSGSLGEAALEILNFLDERLTGRSDKSEDEA